ncbi:MAG TPA: multidrug efflux SMR transporter [Woeseiaceae bacterium]|nr:multidrug efflux SMR transporter [Woeseiaceae bacterium]
MNHWLFLAGAIVMEVCGTVSMKLSNGFEHTLYSILVYIFYGISFYMLAMALKTIDIGIAYAIWAAVGTALIAAIGIVFFSEGINTIKAVSLVAIIAGVVGLNLSGA